MDDLEARLATGLTRGTAHVVFFLDEEFVIRWVSPSSTDMLGWSLDELVGRSGLHFVHPDDLGDIGRLVFEEIRSPHEYGADPARRTFDEVRLATVDGTWKAFEFAANNLIADPEVRGFVVVMRDVTERRMQDDVWSSMAAGSPIEVTAEPHRGCAKYTKRFGLDAMRAVNSPEGIALNLRGVNAKVVVPGVVRPGDGIEKLPTT